MNSVETHPTNLLPFLAIGKTKDVVLDQTKKITVENNLR